MHYNIWTNSIQNNSPTIAKFSSPGPDEAIDVEGK